MSYKNKENSKGKHWLKVGAWIFGIALFLFVGLFFFTTWFQNKLERMVEQQSNGVYELSLYGLQVSPFVGNLSVDSASLVPDYERWQQLNKQNQGVSPTLLDLQSRAIELNGLNYLAVLFGSNVALDELVIEDSEMLVTVMRADTTAQQEPMHETVPDMMKGLQIGLIDLKSGRIRYRKSPDAASTTFSIQQFHLTVDDFKLDSQSFQSQDRAYYAAAIVFRATQANYNTSDGLYKLTADSVRLNTEKRILQAKQVQLNPTTDPTGLARSKGEATSHMNLEIPLLEFSGVDFPAHSRKNNFIVQHTLLQDPSLYAFKDKKNFENKTRRPLPHEIVQNMQIKFLMDTVEVKNGFGQYEEIVPEAEERGNISLEAINASIVNFSNMPEHISMENPAVVQASGMIMGKAPARMTSRMPLLNENGYHTLHIEIESTNPEILNPMVAPTGFVRIESGQISRGSVDVELTNDKATGTLRLIYSNFEIELLSKGTGGEQSLGKEILSEVVNWVAIKESNPDDKGEEPRVGEIDVTRNEKKSIFSYWATCVKEGFMSITTIK